MHSHSRPPSHRQRRLLCCPCPRWQASVAAVRRCLSVLFPLPAMLETPPFVAGWTLQQIANTDLAQRQGSRCVLGAQVRKRAQVGNDCLRQTLPVIPVVGVAMV